MGISIHDLSEDLDPGQLSTLCGGVLSYHWGLASGLSSDPMVTVNNLE
ncbi:MAG: hypothetical protein HY319_04015 [Armatimonadetes bacterium]|nr:hypothetical protein [Armatimonadota bacterium]